MKNADKPTADKPKRVQRKRTKGWKMPHNTVYVGRGSRFGNPYKLGAYGVHTNQQAVDLFKSAVCCWDGYVAFAKNELAGKNLACWCNINEPCHADVLLEISNASK